MTETRKGEIYVLGSAVLWGLFPVFAVITYKSAGPLTSLAASTALAAIFFAALITFRKGWKEIKNKQLWISSFWIALCIGFLFYSFFYIGLKYTTPGNAALVALAEVLTNFLIFQIWRKESMTRAHIFGGIFILLGSALLLLKDFHGFASGDWLIVIAIFCSPFGNLHQQKARKLAGADMVMLLRSLLSVPAILILAYFLGERITFNSIQGSFWYLLFVGVVCLGLSKIFWLEGIHRMTVTKATVIESLSVVFTLFFAYILLAQHPTPEQLLALPLMLLGLWLITNK